MKRVKRKHRWATAKGKVVGVRLSDREYRGAERRAEARGMSISEYIKFLIGVTRDEGDGLEIDGWLLEEWYS
ncbi:hypothetical protein ACFLW4_06805 [Chloroflexota bacterium]